MTSHFRQLITLIETANRTYYHGSYDELPVGSILSPKQNYEEHWQETDFYTALEHYRPANMIAHKNGVFMCDNPEDIDNAGGATDWLFVVQPLGPIQRHDLGWGTEISLLVSNGYDINSPEIKEAAQQYWAGVPHPDNVWEYITSSAKILAVEEY